MKNIFKAILVALIVGTTFSCSESDATINQVLDNVDSTSGVVLRTIVKPQDLVSLNNPANNVIIYSVEVQEGNGSFQPDFKEVRSLIDLYQDQDLINPITDTDGNVIGERLFATFLPGDFTIGPNGLPRIAVELPTQSILDVLPANIDLTVPTFIAMRFEVEMNDGRVFTNVDLGASVTGGTYFGSSYLYKIIFLPI